MNYQMGQPGPQQPLEVDEIWHLRKPKPGRVGINAVEAWDVLKSWNLRAGDPEVRVVLCDYGVEYDHPAMVGRIDTDRARDFDHTLEAEGLTRAQDGRIADPIDAHGTACAGLVCGIRTERRDPALPEKEELRFVGVAPASRLVPFRISTNFEMKSLISALKAAEQAGDVILLPRFLPHDPELDRVLKDVASRVPVICAAGNDGRPPLGYPASLPEVIAVGACNNRGYRSTYSNYGGNNGGRGPDVVVPSNDVAVDDRALTRLDRDEVTLRWRGKQQEEARENGKQPDPYKEPTRDPDELDALARAEGWNLDKFGELSIATTDNRGQSGYNTDPPGDYCKVTGDFGFGGTSAASSLVAGVVALMLTAKPDLKGKPEAIRDLLRKAASLDHLWLQRDRESEGADSNRVQAHKEFGCGLVDASKAVQLARMWKADVSLPSDWKTQLTPRQQQAA